MSAAKLVDVTLVMTWSPGTGVGDEPARIVFAIALDGQGQPDAGAWLADPAPWPARYEAAGKPPMAGDVTHDEDGWSLRFFTDAAAAPDAPMHRILHLGMPRPGEVLTIREPNGAEAAWRVVGIG
ncbi:MAG: hypothetical protein K2X46_04800 [Roseomonas sp.]|nr:hypothetical protein [Roseomonas sp.]